MNNVTVPEGWNGLDNTPPDKLLEVVDAEGNMGAAYPTWYPFKVVKDPTATGKWTSNVVPCDPYWDGGWLVRADGLESKIGDIIAWRDTLDDRSSPPPHLPSNT